MHAYIKDGHTFETKHHGTVLDWDFVLASIDDDTSDIQIAGSANTVLAGDIVFAGEYAGLIKEAEIENGHIRITCIDMINLFNRPLLAVDFPVGSSVEAFVAEQIRANYIELEDVMYRVPYLSIITSTNTQGQGPDTEDGLWTIKEYAAKLRKLYNIHVSFSAARDNLVVRIARMGKNTHKVFLDNSQWELIEESFSRETVGKITTKAEDTGAAQDWYLLTDGSITNTYTPEGRVDGTWEVMTVSKAEEAADKVAEEFASNTASHLIEFATEREYGFCDDVIIRTKKGLIVTSYITSIRQEKGNSKKIYKSGELRLMLEEKLNRKLGGKR